MRWYDVDKLKGSMESLSAMQVTADTKGLDKQSKTLLQYVEVLAVILQDTVTEYKGYSRKEVQEFFHLNEKTSFLIWRFESKIHCFPQKIYRLIYI